MPAHLPILIACCGNAMAGDDAFGPLVAQRLQESAPPGVEVVDCGMQPLGLLTHLDDRRALVVVDAAFADERYPLGCPIDIDFFADCGPRLVHDNVLSSHGLSISHELTLARKLVMLPRYVHLLAVAGTEIGVGKAMQPAVRQQVAWAEQRALELADGWLTEVREASHA